MADFITGQTQFSIGPAVSSPPLIGGEQINLELYRRAECDTCGCFVIKYRNRVSVSQYIRNCKQLSPRRPHLLQRKSSAPSTGSQVTHRHRHLPLSPGGDTSRDCPGLPKTFNRNYLALYKYPLARGFQ